MGEARRRGTRAERKANPKHAEKHGFWKERARRRVAELRAKIAAANVDRDRELVAMLTRRITRR